MFFSSEHFKSFLLFSKEFILSDFNFRFSEFANFQSIDDLNLPLSWKLDRKGEEYSLSQSIVFSLSEQPGRDPFIFIGLSQVPIPKMGDSAIGCAKDAGGSLHFDNLSSPGLDLLNEFLLDVLFVVDDLGDLLAIDGSMRNIRVHC